MEPIRTTVLHIQQSKNLEIGKMKKKLSNKIHLFRQKSNWKVTNKVADWASSSHLGDRNECIGSSRILWKLLESCIRAAENNIHKVWFLPAVGSDKMEYIGWLLGLSSDCHLISNHLCQLSVPIRIPDKFSSSTKTCFSTIEFRCRQRRWLLFGRRCLARLGWGCECCQWQRHCKEYPAKKDYEKKKVCALKNLQNMMVGDFEVRVTVLRDRRLHPRPRRVKGRQQKRNLRSQAH